MAEPIPAGHANNLGPKTFSPPASLSSTGREAAAQAGLAVLVIDDERPILDMMSASLQRIGLTTLIAASAVQAKALLDERIDIGVIVSDINMPSETGLTLARDLLQDRAEEDALEVILMTGRSEMGDAIAAVRAHVFDFVPKPFSIRYIAAVISRALERAQQRRKRAMDNRAIAVRIAETETERRQLLDMLAQTTKELATSNRARKDLIAVVSHELRTPLIPIIGFADIMHQSPVVSPEDSRDWANTIGANGRRLLSMINGALEIVAFDQGMRPAKWAAVDVPVLLANIATSHRQRADAGDVTVLVNADPGLRATADPAAITTAIGHLVDNAIKASPQGATVEIAAQVSARSITISVRDRGPGIPRSVRERLGLPFLQADQSLSRTWEGIGLGLAVAMRIARTHGGRLSLTTRQGGGCVASVELPMPGAAGVHETLASVSVPEVRESLELVGTGGLTRLESPVTLSTALIREVHHVDDRAPPQIRTQGSALSQ